MPTALLASRLPQSFRPLTVIWLAALVGLLLLPVNYRADGPSAHGHSVYQLLADAADGALGHHPATVAPDDAERLDAGDHNDSTPASPGPHLFIVPVFAFAIAAARRAPTEWTLIPPPGRRPAVPHPPPRVARTAI